VLTLVFPHEIISLPYIGKAFAAFKFGNVLIKSKDVSGLVCGGGVRLVENLAQINECD
jgi:hypothetical protein